MPRRSRKHVRLQARKHGIVLARPLARALAVAAAGGVLAFRGVPYSLAGAVVLIVAALLALRAVWRWERTILVITGDELVVLHGGLRRRTASVPLHRIDVVEIEQSLLGRLLGYGTLVAGPLEVPHVARPREVSRLVA